SGSLRRSGSTSSSTGGTPSPRTSCRQAPSGPCETPRRRKSPTCDPRQIFVPLLPGSGFKGARWTLLKNPTDLSDDQAATLRKLRRRGGDLWRAYTLKEALREVFAGDLGELDVALLLERFCSRASRSRIKPFLTLAKTIRQHMVGILAAVRLG